MTIHTKFITYLEEKNRRLGNNQILDIGNHSWLSAYRFSLTLLIQSMWLWTLSGLQNLERILLCFAHIIVTWGTGVLSRRSLWSYCNHVRKVAYRHSSGHAWLNSELLLPCMCARLSRRYVNLHVSKRVVCFLIAESGWSNSNEQRSQARFVQQSVHQRSRQCLQMDWVGIFLISKARLLLTVKPW